MDKVRKVMSEYKHGELHSGSKKGPVVHSRKQAIAIGLSEARKAGQSVSKKKHKVASHMSAYSSGHDYFPKGMGGRPPSGEYYE